ncbi:MAG: hypothetical protein ACJAXT_001046 [Paracoccaceae bacterium]|jgi:hypothetical protein
MTYLVENELERAERMLARAMQVVDVAQTVLSEAVGRLKNEQVVKGSELIADLKAMSGALHFALSMEEKTRDATRQKDGRRDVGELDLEAARTEISLRLACLRDAGCDRSVSGGVE